MGRMKCCKCGFYFDIYDGAELNYCPLCDNAGSYRTNQYPLDKCPICKNDYSYAAYKTTYKFCPQCGVPIPRTQRPNNEYLFEADK